MSEEVMQELLPCPKGQSEQVWIDQHHPDKQAQGGGTCDDCYYCAAKADEMIDASAALQEKPDDK